VGANNVYEVEVTANDGAGGTETDVQVISVTVNDLNEAPTINDQSLGPIDENLTNGTSVGTVVASDVDADDSLTFSIIGGNTGGAFAINNSTGEITVANSAALDFETNPSFNLTIQVEDTGSLSDTATVTINLKDVNERYVVIDPPGSNPLFPDTLVEDQQADGDGLDEPTDVTISDPDLSDIRPTPPRLFRTLRSRLLTPLHGIEMHLTVFIGARLTGSYDIWNVFDIRSIHRPGDSHSDAKDVSVSMTLIDLSGIDRAAEASQFSIGGSDERLWQELDNFVKALTSQNDYYVCVEVLRIGTVIALIGTISIGYVTWLLPGGALLRGMLSYMPAWRSLDPLPVLEHWKKNQKSCGRHSDTEKDDEDESEQRIQSLFE
jgi:hypothetical protein